MEAEGDVTIEGEGSALMGTDIPWPQAKECQLLIESAKERTDSLLELLKRPALPTL